MITTTFWIYAFLGEKPSLYFRKWADTHLWNPVDYRKGTYRTSIGWKWVD